MMTQKVFITGANRGIGLGLVRYYLYKDYRVFAVHRDENYELENLAKEYANLCLIKLDLSDEQVIGQLAKSFAKYQVQIDILINNAGVNTEQAIGQWTQTAFVQNYLINAVAPALLIQSLAAHLSPTAKIIQLSSGVASFTNSEDTASLPLDSYAMSKVALNMLVRRLAIQTKATGQVYCALSPGWVRTAMGGQQAPLSVAQAVESMAKTITDLGIQHSGGFFDEQGNAIPW